MDATRLLDGLDAQQRRAVTDPAQPLCIIAGAGSGKTRVLTRRIAHRCATGTADPRHVLALTFTRKAAFELMGRVGALGLRDRPVVGTFHSVAWSQVKAYWRDHRGSYREVLERKSRILSRLEGRGRLGLVELATEIEWARARMIRPQDYVDAAQVHDRRVSAPLATVARLYEAYEAEKRSQRVVDFDDILEICADAVESDPAFARAQHWRFRHLFVDEYQDVNPLQHRLLRAWLGGRPDLCVVGDPRQAIYRWNGADPRYLTRFTEDHPGAAVVELTANYRSAPEILHLGAAALGPEHLPAVATRPMGTVPTISRYATDEDEARAAADAARLLRAPGTRWDRQAVLVRTNAQIPLLAKAFTRARIPHRVRGTDALGSRPEVRDALKQLGRGPLRTALDDLDAIVREAERVAQDGGGDEAGTHLAEQRMGSLQVLLRLAYELSSFDPDASVRDLHSWLAAYAGGDEIAADAVSLVTFHAAKGLEWPVVHVLGLEDGLVPVAHARTPQAEAEERRLLHVAITRAEDVLRLSWAEQRTLRDRAVARRPSPYLEHLERALRTAATMDRPADPGPALRRARETLAGAEARRADDEAVLLRALRAWRDRAARAAGVPGAVVLSDRTLAEVARARPADHEALAAVPSLGPLARDAYGADLLRTVRDHAPAGRAS